MNRRNFILAITCLPFVAYSKTFKIKIKTKTGGIIGLRMQAKDVFAAIHKVKKRYPGCEILEAGEI